MWPVEIITATTSACATATANNPTSVFANSVSIHPQKEKPQTQYNSTVSKKRRGKTRAENLLAAMADPTPAKTKRKVTMNSTMRARMQSGWVASPMLPNAILAIDMPVSSKAELQEA